MKDTCKTCRYFNEILLERSTFCFRYPPVVYPMAPSRLGEMQTITLYPTVRPEQWCGEHRAKVELVMERSDLQ